MTFRGKLSLQHEGTVAGLIVSDVFKVEWSDCDSFCVQHLQALEAAGMFLLQTFLCMLLFFTKQRGIFLNLQGFSLGKSKTIPCRL